MGFGQEGKGEGEARPRALSAARRRGAERRELGIHLHACREQEQIALEGGKAEALGQAVDARRGRELGAAALPPARRHPPRLRRGAARFSRANSATSRRWFPSVQS